MKFEWKFQHFHWKIVFENIVCQMAVILPRGSWFNKHHFMEYAGTIMQFYTLDYFQSCTHLYKELSDILNFIHEFVYYISSDLLECKNIWYADGILYLICGYIGSDCVLCKHTIMCKNTVHYCKILHKYLQELRLDINQVLDPQQTPHTSL